MQTTISSYEPDCSLKSNGFEWTRSKTPTRKKHIRRQEFKAGIVNYQQISPRLNVCKPKGGSLEEKFKKLLNKWQEESMFLSSLTEMVMLRSYQAIIGMGPDVVPIILKELKHDPDYLFWALEAITGDNPVLPEDEGNLDRMTDAWIKWGQENGKI